MKFGKLKKAGLADLTKAELGTAIREKLRMSYLYNMAWVDEPTCQLSKFNIMLEFTRPTWRLSTTMDADFCVDALEEAIESYGTPEIFNTDQGAQFTSEDFTGVLKGHGIISIDGNRRLL